MFQELERIHFMARFFVPFSITDNLVTINRYSDNFVRIHPHDRADHLDAPRRLHIRQENQKRRFL